jgi:hypothetical protein
MTMASLAGLPEVGPHAGDTLETLGLRTCDLCGQSTVDDGWHGRPDRTFYFDPAEGLSICEHCTEAYLAEKP